MKWLYPIGLLFIAGSVNAEVINLTCLSTSGPYNLTIATPPTVKNSVVYFDDKEPENFGSFVQWTDSISIGKSIINFATNLKDTDNGNVIRIFYTISRLSGQLTTLGFSNGKNPRAGESQQCGPRKANKF